MDFRPHNWVGLHGWTPRSNLDRYPYDFDFSQRYIRGAPGGVGVRDVFFGLQRRASPWTYWYDVNAAYRHGWRPGYDGPTVPRYSPNPPPVMQAQSVGQFIGLLDAPVYALMLDRHVGGPWAPQGGRQGGVPWETAFDGLRMLGPKRQ